MTLQVRPIRPTVGAIYQGLASRFRGSPPLSEGAG